MTESKKAKTPDALLNAAGKDAKIELSEEELKSVTGGDKTVILEHEKVTGADKTTSNHPITAFAKTKIDSY